MRRLIFPALFFASACENPPARIVAGVADTVVINSNRPVLLPIRVLDADGHVLTDTAVRYRWKSGLPISVSAKGVVGCSKSGDATVRASLGPLATDVLVRCRPVRTVRALRMLNLVVGGPDQDLPFEAVGMDGQPVTLMTGQITVEDSAILSVTGLSIRALAAGESGLTMRVGNRTAFTNVQAYAVARSPEGLRPGQRVAVPVRVAGGEMQRWRLSRSPHLYFLAMLPDSSEELMPRLAIVGANCFQGLGPHTFFCLARQEASVIVYHPQNVDPRQTLRGTLAVWRQEWIQ
jgi:hypothetical protein